MFHHKFPKVSGCGSWNFPPSTTARTCRACTACRRASASSCPGRRRRRPGRLRLKSGKCLVSQADVRRHAAPSYGLTISERSRVVRINERVKIKIQDHPRQAAEEPVEHHFQLFQRLQINTREKLRLDS